MNQRAKSLRQQSTPAERALWRLLHPLRTGNFHFRKQAPIGPYFADIACHHAKLVIEVDGDTHALPGAKRHDKVRDEFLEREGYQVLRLSNAEVLNNPEGVYAVVEQALLGANPNRRARREATLQP